MPVSTKKLKTSGAKLVSRREMAVIVDAHAKRVLGVSRKVFISKAKAGKYAAGDSDA